MSVGEVTHQLQLWREGDKAAVARLTPLVYDHLRNVAVAYLRNDQQNQDWQATELVDEVFLRLLALKKVALEDRRHFFIFSARIMREILVDHAREMKAAKRGAEIQHIPLNSELAWTGADHSPETLDLNSALDQLEALDESKARVVELRYFFGFTADESAELLGVSKSTVDRDLRFALTWLHGALHPES
jgi:RNA polymerase sigma factor (TIGR02999 family)